MGKKKKKGKKKGKKNKNKHKEKKFGSSDEENSSGQFERFSKRGRKKKGRNRFKNYKKTQENSFQGKVKKFEGKKFSKSKKGAVGLYNQGNTCYMNSALQCMTKVPVFVNYYVDSSIENFEVKKEYSKEYVKKKKNFTKAFVELMRCFWKGNHKTITPSDVKKQISKYAPQFSGFQQHDSSEVIEYMLNALHAEECRRKKSKTKVVFLGSIDDIKPKKESGDKETKQSELQTVEEDEKILENVQNEKEEEEIKIVEEERKEEESQETEEEVIPQEEIKIEKKTVESTKEETHQEIKIERVQSKKFPAKEEKYEEEEEIFDVSQMWKDFKSKNNSVIVENFCGLVKSVVKCQTCGKKSKKFEPFLILRVSIPPKKSSQKLDLDDCLNVFLKPERLDRDNKWDCPVCKSKRIATKKMDLIKLPQILIVQIKKFKKNRKINAYVEYPHVFDITIEKFNEEKGREVEKEYSYDLFAVSKHSGSLHFGHYTAFAKVEEDWFNFNDSKVTKVSRNQIICSQGYVLFYERKQE